MSLNSENDDLNAIINRLLDNLSFSITSQSGRDGAILRTRIGDIRSNYYSMLVEGTFPQKLLDCFNSATDSGATLDSLSVVHNDLFLESPDGEWSKSVVQMAIVFCLSTESTIASEIDFKSRQDVELLINKFKLVFDKARLLAADAIDSSAYQQLTALAGALTDHLANVARPLARMITFNLAKPMPALSISQYIYYTATRWEEVVDENKVVHPLFCPRTIRGLSA